MPTPKFLINEADIAAANVSFTLVQFVLDVLIEKKLLTMEQVSELMGQIAAFYEKPGGPPLRGPVKSAAAESLRDLVKTKYRVPPKGQQH